MSAERYTLDANILVYAIDSAVGNRNVIARDLWASAQIHDCVMTTQALAEAYNAIARKLPKLRDGAYDLLATLAVSVPVVAADASDFEEAITAHRTRPVHFWDAMLWATAKRSGCRVIVTENMPDRPTVEGVSYFNPFLDEHRSALKRFLL